MNISDQANLDIILQYFDYIKLSSQTKNIINMIVSKLMTNNDIVDLDKHTKSHLEKYAQILIFLDKDFYHIQNLYFQSEINNIIKQFVDNHSEFYKNLNKIDIYLEKILDNNNHLKRKFIDTIISRKKYKKSTDSYLLKLT